ncbi:MAG: hypothetical protein IJO70_06245 [Lachnospiraceae bacterium]|nr:hypothetical protein [Lachnospiraceae bacterium]
MSWWMIMLIVIAVALIILFVLYRIGNKLQAKQMAQKEQMAEAAQPMTMLVIDKKYLPMKDAGLPKIVLEQTPKRYQKQKLPIVKAKVGPQILNLICDDAIFDEVTKGEVKAMVSGIYILSVKSVRRKNAAAVEEENKKVKKGLGAKMRAKQAAYQKQLNDDIMAKAQNKAKTPEKSKAELKKEKQREKMISKNAVK